MLCSKCGGRKVFEGKVCSCYYKDELDLFLPEYLKTVPFSESFLKTEVFCKPVGKTSEEKVSVVYLLENFDVVFKSVAQSRFDSFLKTWLSFMYKTKPFNYKIKCGNEIADAYYQGSKWKKGVDTELSKELTDVDFLVLMLGFDPPNETYSALLINFLNKRRLCSRRTWVYLDPRATQEDLVSTYQAPLFKVLEDKSIFYVFYNPSLSKK